MSASLPVGHVISTRDVFAAAARIYGAVHVTPVLRSDSIDRLASAAAGFPVEAVFKCELFQKTGSFKARGACNAVRSLGEQDAAAGVVTHSSGNHAAALAYAARQRGIPAHIVMPSNSPAVKKTAVRGYGASVTECEPTQAAREAAAAAVSRATLARFVHPSENPLVIAGQGTLALELLAQVAAACGGGPLVPRTPEGRAAAEAYAEVAARLGIACAAEIDDAVLPGVGSGVGLAPPPPLDVVIVPVGGGGMIGGVAVALRALDPRIRIVGAEPAGADDAARSKASGTLQTHLPGGPATIADGLRTTLGEQQQEPRERGGMRGERLACWCMRAWYAGGYAAQFPPSPPPPRSIGGLACRPLDVAAGARPRGRCRDRPRRSLGRSPPRRLRAHEARHRALCSRRCRPAAGGWAGCAAWAGGRAAAGPRPSRRSRALWGERRPGGPGAHLGARAWRRS